MSATDLLRYYLGLMPLAIVGDALLAGLLLMWLRRRGR